ncbi:AAA domain-containing protein [Plectosphaerella cucumerina]|uniref:AAA domain-containing protein n=1 Tax=Plectosphaerella cucumerina TaxID=40658 RepID=A0A8K0WYQ0_9PEZI|nr:AAA domain-containing protein [Plectosphaerella cucumerina]
MSWYIRARGGRGRGRGSASRTPTHLCRHFLKGTCRFGKQCKFSHDQSTDNEASLGQQERDEVQERFHAWKRARFGRVPASWMTTALDLLSESADIRHQVIRTLASDDCVPTVARLVQGVDIISSTHDRHKYLTNTILPLFRVLSHPQVINSFVLEQEVGILFRCLLGVEGARFTSLFEFIFRVIRETANDGALDEPSLQVLSISAEIFAKLVDSSVTNIVNPAFHRVAEHFATFLDQPPGAKPGFWQIQTTNHADYARRRLGIGQALPDKGPAHPVGIDRAQFSVGQDLPGALSLHGPRHDNDHANIRKISVMPTMEEISSSRAEYLPTITAPSHLGGAQGLLDRQFRLIREDLFGDLRSAVQAELDYLTDTPALADSARPHRTKIRRYEVPCGSDIEFGFRQGLELEIRIFQPQFARKQDKGKRAEAWKGRLSQGALVCAVDEVGTAMFFLVSASTTVSAPSTEENGRSLADDPKFAHVWLQPVDKTANGVVRALSWYKGLSGPQRRRLLEFPGILLPSALPPLEALQRMSSRMDFPFQDILAAPEAVVGQLSAPLYSLRPGFSFDLSCLCNDETKLEFNASDEPDPTTLSDHSSLDPTQASAILSSLQRTNARLGPIICVCYTNHALDQLLEHLLDKGVKQIIRIGSRSKSERLAKVNLWTVATDLPRTRTEGKALYDSRSALESNSEAIAKQLRHFKHANADEMVKEFIAEEFPLWYRQIFGETEIEDEGWTAVKKKKDAKTTLRKWLQSGDMPPTESRSPEELVTLQPADLSRRERMILHQYWIKMASEERLDESITGLCSDYNAQYDRDQGIKADINLRCLESANIIGVTTTGLARNLSLIQKTRAKVLVCEEAAEVLEGHLLTALLPSIEHAILIGDHLQLRPQIQDWRLQKANPAGEKYSLDVSLFERLVQRVEVMGADGVRRSRPCIPFNILDTQRRMHPSIAELVRSTLYSTLVDADNVHQYPEVIGMAKRLFWMNHQQFESNHEKQDSADTSHSNDFEVGMVSALVSHLLRQGVYKAGEIAVLTPYLGQLQKLRKALGATMQIVLNDRDTEVVANADADANDDDSSTPLPLQLGKSSSLAEVRVATVDNFQGEEAKVVIVSLVRSNNDRRPGFLNTSNRINVLLSRAKHGMYLIGNTTTFSTVPMWKDVIQLLEADGNLGPKLQLQCPRHLSTEISVQTPEDFLIMAPDGGCTLRCERRLGCGHVCTGPCHADTLHQAVKCLEACARFKDGCDHSCPRLCGEPCEVRCNQMIEGLKIVLPCGHGVSSAPCWQVQDPSKIQCMVKVSKLTPDCGHSVAVPCSVDVTSSKYACREVCGSALQCGHTCKRKCYKCYRVNGEVKEANHGVCTQPCDRDFNNCSHRCKLVCHGELACPPCKQPCESRCSHSKCSQICSEPCVPCAEMSCSSVCPHSQCLMPCAAPCNWVPCSLRCDKMLSCGHRCPSLCGEKCPTAEFCQVCASDDIKSLIVDLYVMEEYKDINLDEEPCLFPNCGHPLTFTNMDAQMGMKDHYTLNSNAIPIAVKAPSTPFSSDGEVKIRVCPQCRGPLRNVARYGRLIRRGLLDEATKKFITWSASELNRLALELATAEEAMDSQAAKSTQGQDQFKTTTKLVDLTLSRRDRFKAVSASLPGANKMRPVRAGLEQHLAKVGKNEQPYQRVANRVRFGGFAERGEVEVQMSGYFKTLAMLLRCDIVLLEHFFARRAKSEGDQMNVDEYMVDFRLIVNEAHERQLWRLKAETHILLARLYCIAHIYQQTLVGESAPDQSLRELGEAEVQLAREVLELRPSTRNLQSQVDALEKSFLDTFYSPVTAEERLAVYKAMSQEFLGTGHWYTCEQGHPFTVGECGMPMELARCPECGGAVGGQHHTPAAGVQHATDMDELGRNVGRMGL